MSFAVASESVRSVRESAAEGTASSSSFYTAMRILPPQQREAMF